MPIYRIVIYFLLTISALGSYGAEVLSPVIVTRHFGAADGLSSKTIYSIQQDKDGFLWFGTDAGAFRYDGSEFKRYTIEDGLSDNEILQLFVDDKGRVWFLTYNGYLSFYYKGIIYNSNNAPFLKSAYIGGSFVNAIADNGKIWFASFKRGYVSIDDTVVKAYVLPPKEREYSFPYFVIDSNQALWYFRDSSLVKFDDFNQSLVVPNYPFAFTSVNGLSDVMFLNADNVYRLQNLKMEPYMVGKLLPDYTKVVTIKYEEDFDNLWICTLGNGCSLYHNKKFVQTYLPNSSVTGVMRDSEGNIWICTMNDGVYVYYQNNNYITNYDKSSGLIDNKVYSLAVDKKNDLWLGYYNGEIDKISNHKKTSFKLTTWNSADYLRTMSIIPYRDTIWCANDGGIYYITNDVVTRIRYPDVNAVKNNYSVKHLSIDQNGSIYGAFSFNLITVEKSSVPYYSRAIFDTILRVFSSVKTPEGKLYISSIGGLIEYLPGKELKYLSQDFDFSKVRIPDMKLDKRGELILATNVNGIFIVKNSRVIDHITVEDNLTDNSCRKLLLDDSLLYICTQNGLNIFTRRNDKWVFKDKINVRDGLLDNSINDIATNDSLLFIATDGGVSILNKNVFSASHYIRSICITEVVLDKPHQVTDGNFELTSMEPGFIVKFSYPVYNPANKVKFKYRLRKETESTEWLNTSSNQIQFSSLSPGKYIFEAVPYIGTQTAQISSLFIEVKPMWWQTFIARTLIFLTILVIVTLIAKQLTRIQYEKRLRSLKEKEAIEAERNRIATDMHDDIGADLTQISIWSNVLKSNNSDAKLLVQKISVLSNEVLSKMDQIIWALNSVHNQSTDLISYIHSYSAEYLEENDINLFFELKENIPDFPMSASKRRNIFLVIKELLHNTVKHSGATNVKICIYFDGEQIVIEYCDDGKGFILIANGEGLGMRTIVRRMEEIHSKIHLEPGMGSGMKATLHVSKNEQIFNV